MSYAYFSFIFLVIARFSVKLLNALTLLEPLKSTQGNDMYFQVFNSVYFVCECRGHKTL